MFNGFSQETVDFMWGIRFNNNREWFQAHKAEYQTHFQQPMTALADDLPRRAALIRARAVQRPLVVYRRASHSAYGGVDRQAVFLV